MQEHTMFLRILRDLCNCRMFQSIPPKAASELSGSRAAGLGLIYFRALLQLAPAGASVASAGAELCPRDKLFGFVAAVARSRPLLTSGRLGPRMQSF